MAVPVWGLESGGVPWRRRHAWIVGLIAVQALLLAMLAVAGDHATWTLIPALTIAAPAVMTALPELSRRAAATTSAVALLTQATFAVVVFDGDVRINLLLLSVLCVIALYEVGIVLGAAFACAGVIATVIAATRPDLLSLPSDDPGRLWTAVLAAAGATAVASVALTVLWRDHRDTRHRAQQQSRAIEAYLTVAGTLLLVLDPDGIVTMANRQTCLTLDREESAVVGQDWFELALPPEYHEEGRRLYRDTYASFEEIGELIYEPTDYENEVVASDGSRRQIVWWATMVSDHAGRPISMVCSGTDVTEQRAARAAVERSARELEALRRLAQKVASLDDSRQAVVDAAYDLTGAKVAAILEPDRTRSRLRTSVATRPEFNGRTIELGREVSLAANAFLSGQPQFAGDATKDPSANQRLVEEVGAVSTLHQPILGAHGTIGVLIVSWDHPMPSLQTREAELVGLIAHEAAIALRRRESLEQLERAALVDPLTGVANRRAFDAELPLALRRATDGRYPLGLVVLDLNDFKAVNDELGHEAGDELLISAAAAWADALRAGDLLARLGGDEFAVILPSCDELELTHIVARLQRHTPHAPGASVGGAMWDGVEGASSLIRRADHAQYANKAAMKRENAGHGPAPRTPISPRPERADPRGA